MSAADLVRHPEALGVLVVAPLVWALLVWRDRRRARRVAALIGRRAPVLAAERSEPRRRTRRVLLALGLLLALGAALGPMFGEAAPDLAWRGVDMVVCLDVSRSMLARDVEPSRLGNAKAQVRALAERAEGDRLGLVVFAGEARRLVPLTADGATFAALADEAEPTDVRRGGTDLGAALVAAADVLAGGSGDGGVVLLATDGEDHEGRGARAAEALAARGIVVHAVGLGSALGGKIAVPNEVGEGAFLRDRAGRDVVTVRDEAGLRRIAETTGGTYADGTRDARALLSLYEDRVLPMARSSYEREGLRRREDRYQWFLLAAFVLWVVALSLGDRRRA